MTNIESLIKRAVKVWQYMNDTVLARIKEYDVPGEITELIPITKGASGAYVFSGKGENGEYIIKYTPLENIDPIIKKQFVKEYYFYEASSVLKADFIPEVIFQAINPNEVLIVLKKYNEIRSWNENILLSAAEAYAKVNSLDMRYFEKVLQKDAEPTGECYPLSVSYENWIKLAGKFLGSIDTSVLSDIYKHYGDINNLIMNLRIPRTICHGDFHPGNCLKDGEKIIICDWQNVGLGKGVGDISFFIGRGKDMGIGLNTEAFIRKYRESLKEFTSIDIDINDIYKKISASNLSCSFRFWAEYLQDSELGRITEIYNSMVRDYRFLFY